MAQKRSVSVVKGRGSMAHNNRDFTTPNVDPSKSSNNITYLKESLEDAYKKCFGLAVADYNATQKRNDRKITNYMEQIRTSKNGEKLFYEIVVQVGNKFDTSVGSEIGLKAKQILSEYMERFQNRNPNLYVFNAVIHLDEATPHLHIDYIPIASGYEKGMQVRNSLDKALKQQGIEGKSSRYENATLNWQEKEKCELEIIMNKHDLERASDRGLHEKHKTIDQYKCISRQIRQQVKVLPKQIEATPTLLDKNKVTVNKEDLELLEKRAKLSLVHERETTELLKQETEVFHKVSVRENELYQKEFHLGQSETQIEDMKFDLNNRIDKQKTLNQDYGNLTIRYNNLMDKCNSLVRENQSLKAQIIQLTQQIEDQIKEAVKPIQEKLQSLISRLDGMVKTIVAITKAIGMFKYDKGEYKAALTKKQGDLVDAIAEYSKFWIEKDGGKDIDLEIYQTDIDRNVGISKGIESFLTPEYKEIIYYKGEKGYGFYASKAEGGVFLGVKADFAQLRAKFSTTSFKDPYGHIPGISDNHHQSL